jgi:cell pole-organizing protein PopZ
MTKESAQLAEKQEQGIDQILSDIKDVITNTAPTSSDEVLELTEVIQEVKAANESKPTPQPEPNSNTMPTTQPVSAANDILATIDSAIASKSAEPAPFQNFSQPAQLKPANNGTVENLLDEAVAATSRQTLKNFMKMTEKTDIESLKLRSGGTVEDIIIELIKPQISEWLNKNLPALVSSVVEKEIKKLVPKDE